MAIPWGDVFLQLSKDTTTRVSTTTIQGFGRQVFQAPLSNLRESLEDEDTEMLDVTEPLKLVEPPNAPKSLTVIELLKARMILSSMETSKVKETVKAKEILEAKETPEATEPLKVTEPRKTRTILKTGNTPKVKEALEATEPRKVTEPLEVTEPPEVPEPRKTRVILKTRKTLWVKEAPEVSVNSIIPNIFITTPEGEKMDIDDAPLWKKIAQTAESNEPRYQWFQSLHLNPFWQSRASLDSLLASYQEEVKEHAMTVLKLKKQLRKNEETWGASCNPSRDKSSFRASRTELTDEKVRLWDMLDVAEAHLYLAKTEVTKAEDLRYGRDADYSSDPDTPRMTRASAELASDAQLYFEKKAKKARRRESRRAEKEAVEKEAAEKKERAPRHHRPLTRPDAIGLIASLEKKQRKENKKKRTPLPNNRPRKIKVCVKRRGVSAA